MYFATLRDETIFAEYDLRQLLALVDDLHGPGDEEDVVCWYAGRVVVVVQPTGRHVWLQPQHKPGQEERWGVTG